MANQDAIWDYFQTADQESFAGCRQRVMYLLKHVSSGNLLNVGIGNFFLETEAVRRGLEVYSLDPSETAISLLRDQLQMGPRAQVGRIENIPFAEGQFRHVVASEVLEHLEPGILGKGLDEIHRVLAPGGVFLGTVPANENLASSHVVCPACGHGFHRWGHMQAFTVQSMRDLLAARFQAVSVRSRLFVPWHMLNGFGKLASSVKLALSLAGSHRSGETLFFRAVK